jgi:AcrR family transcriptional regulator
MPERRTQASRSQSTQDQIVHAALGVFALKGYAASSMDDICMAAGCSKGGLYHHFPTKTAVLSGVVKRMAAAGALMPPFPGDFAVPASAAGKILIELWAEAARRPEIRDQLRAAYEAILDASISKEGRLGEILRIGTLVQMLTQDGALSAEDAARRLGIAAEAA